MDRFNLMLLCVSKCTRLCHSYLKTTPDHFYCPDGVFLIKYIFWGKKSPIKRRVTVLSSLQKDNKGTVSTSNDHFMQRDLGEFEDQLFWNNLDNKKGPWYPLFRQPMNITATFDVAILCAVGDAQCKTRELP